MNGFYFDEPELEFGNGRHIDIRAGLTHLGPLDARSELAPKIIRLGVVGDRASIDRFNQWVDKCRSGIAPKETRLLTLFPGFPGFGQQGPFCDITCDPQMMRTFSKQTLEGLAALDDRDSVIKESGQYFVTELSDLTENSPVDVGICLLPEILMRRIDAFAESGAGSQRNRGQTEGDPIWHDIIKSKAIHLKAPIQVVRPATYGGDVHRFRRDGKASKDVEDEASRAWNFFTALYYKARGIPWRMIRHQSSLASCFIGISFFHSPIDQSIHTSVAQVFDERGQGVVVRGGHATVIKDDRTVHLTSPDMQSLVRNVLELFRKEHRHMPARIVVHKSSYFTDEEIGGVKAAAKEVQIDLCDLLSMRKSSTRFFRNKPHPTLRGSAIELDAKHVLLYTQGSVDYYRACASKYVPRPIEIKFDDVEGGLSSLVPEILALTKMNWNSTRFVNAEPITIAAARKVADVIRYLASNDPIHSRYSHYM